MTTLKPATFMKQLSSLSRQVLLIEGAARPRPGDGTDDSVLEFTFDGDYTEWIRIPVSWLGKVYRIGSAKMPGGERVERVRLEVRGPSSEEARQLMQLVLSMPDLQWDQQRLRSSDESELEASVHVGWDCRATVECTGGEWKGGSFGGKGQDDRDKNQDKAIDRAVRDAAGKCDDFSPEFTFEKRDIRCTKITEQIDIHG